MNKKVLRFQIAPGGHQSFYAIIAQIYRWGTSFSLSVNHLGIGTIEIEEASSSRLTFKLLDKEGGRACSLVAESSLAAACP